MKVFNLTDANLPYRPPRKPRTLVLHRVSIAPGECAEVPDLVPTSDFSGWVLSNMVSIGDQPLWYHAAKNRAAHEDRKRAYVADKEARASEPPKKKTKRRKKD